VSSGKVTTEREIRVIDDLSGESIGWKSEDREGGRINFLTR